MSLAPTLPTHRWRWRRCSAPRGSLTTKTTAPWAKVHGRGGAPHPARLPPPPRLVGGPREGGAAAEIGQAAAQGVSSWRPEGGSCRPLPCPISGGGRERRPGAPWPSAAGRRQGNPIQGQLQRGAAWWSRKGARLSVAPKARSASSDAPRTLGSPGALLAGSPPRRMVGWVKAKARQPALALPSSTSPPPSLCTFNGPQFRRGRGGGFRRDPILIQGVSHQLLFWGWRQTSAAAQRLLGPVSDSLSVGKRGWLALELGEEREQGNALAYSSSTLFDTGKTASLPSPEQISNLYREGERRIPLLRPGGGPFEGSPTAWPSNEPFVVVKSKIQTERAKSSPVGSDQGAARLGSGQHHKVSSPVGQLKAEAPAPFHYTLRRERNKPHL